MKKPETKKSRATVPLIINLVTDVTRKSALGMVAFLFFTVPYIGQGRKFDLYLKI